MEQHRAFFQQGLASQPADSHAVQAYFKRWQNLQFYFCYVYYIIASPYAYNLLPDYFMGFQIAPCKRNRFIF